MTFEESPPQCPASGRLSNGPPLLFNSAGQFFGSWTVCSLPVLKGSFWVRDFPVGRASGTRHGTAPAGEDRAEPAARRSLPSRGHISGELVVAFLGTAQVTPCA